MNLFSQAELVLQLGTRLLKHTSHASTYHPKAVDHLSLVNESDNPFTYRHVDGTKSQQGHHALERRNGIMSAYISKMFLVMAVEAQRVYSYRGSCDI